MFIPASTCAMQTTLEIDPDTHQLMVFAPLYGMARTPSPEPEYLVNRDELYSSIDSAIGIHERKDVKRLDALEEQMRVTSRDLEMHKLSTGKEYNKTRIALIVTMITTLGGVTTAIITYLTTRYIHQGST